MMAEELQQDVVTQGNSNLISEKVSSETLQKGQDPFYKVKNNHTHTYILEIHTNAKPQKNESKATTNMRFRTVVAWDGK